MAKVLNFTPACGRGTTRSRRVHETGTSAAGTPWTYTASYRKDCDGETDENYTLRFGDITFSHEDYDHTTERNSITGPKFHYSWSPREGPPRSMSALYNALSALAEKEGVLLRHFAEELAEGTYCSTGAIRSCVDEGEAAKAAKLARSLCMAVRVGAGAKRWRARAAHRAYAPGGSGFTAARADFESQAVATPEAAAAAPDQAATAPEAAVATTAEATPAADVAMDVTDANSAPPKPTLTPASLLDDGSYIRATCGMHPKLLSRLRDAVATKQGAAAPLRALCEELADNATAKLRREARVAIVVAPPIGPPRCVVEGGGVCVRVQPCASPGLARCGAGGGGGGDESADVVVWLMLDPLNIDSKQTTFCHSGRKAHPTYMRTLYKWSGSATPPPQTELPSTAEEE